MNLRIATGFLLLVYSLILMSIEFQYGQEHVRPYFTDLQGSVFLYGINTSFTAFLLLACALLFFISSTLLSSPVQKWFCYSQIFIFTYMGLDDRFLIHEMIGRVLHKNDAWTLLIMGGLEVVFLLFLGKFFSMPRKIQTLLVTAAGLFALMVYVDVRGAEDGFMRLSLEDLLKSWSVFFLFLYAYSYMQIYALKQVKTD